MSSLGHRAVSPSHALGLARCDLAHAVEIGLLGRSLDAALGLDAVLSSEQTRFITYVTLAKDERIRARHALLLRGA